MRTLRISACGLDFVRILLTKSLTPITHRPGSRQDAQDAKIFWSSYAKFLILGALGGFA